MTLADAAEGLMALHGTTGRAARRGALLMAAVLLANRPNMPTVVLDLNETEDA